MKDLLYSEPYRFSFFQAVRLLERTSPGKEGVGRAVRPGNEIVRFRSHPSLAFPPSEIVELKAPPPGQEDRPPEMTINFIGLTGPQAVLPYPYTELVRERISHKDTALWAFLDIFNHRFASLFYRAWEKYRFPIAYERQNEDAFTEYLFDLIGMGTPGLRGRMAVNDQALLLYAGHLAQKPHSASSIASILRDYFRVPADIVQFQGQWFPLEAGERHDARAGELRARPDGRGGLLGFRVPVEVPGEAGSAHAGAVRLLPPRRPGLEARHRPHEVPGRPGVRLRRPARPPQAGRSPMLPRLEIGAPPDARVDDVGHQRNAPERRRRGRPSGR
ncbi:MAG: type VI secretion system baseplate subunit TssG [Holophagales bacterium]|nr:type VI secretion system baseplate subunit TssG [Holophagales bacterium]